MLLPWLTTKADEAEASGRFGIGQQTLRSLGGPIEVHCPPFHFKLAPDGPQWVDPAPDIAGLYSAAARNTLVRVPLDPTVDVDGLVEFITGLDGRSLLFLRSVRRLSLVDPFSGDPVLEHELLVEAHEAITLRLRDQDVPAEWARLRDTVSARAFHRYLAKVPVARSERRRHKALGGVVTIGAAIPCEAGQLGGAYDRLPLPIPWAFTFSLNAPFDPDAARTTVLQNGWNERRLDDLGQLVAAAVVDCFLRDPTIAWRGIPLHDEVADELGGWLAEHVRSRIVEAAHERLATELRVITSDGPRSLAELLFETEGLDGVLTNSDLKLLNPNFTPMPSDVRDESGRWRAVLRELGLSYELDVTEALDLFDLPQEEFGLRDPGWFVEMARAAIAADLLGHFLRKPSVLLADGRRVEPPATGDPKALVSRISLPSVGALLGIALLIHPAYLDGGADAQIVEAALRGAKILLEEADSAGVAFDILARGQDETDVHPIQLDDSRVVALRDAFETLGDERQRTLGPRVGKNIQLRGYTFTSRRAKQGCWVRPVDAYLPSAIDKETGSFARAAGTTLGLSWLDGSYARVLKRAGGRKELGAQRFLVRIGAAAQPRLVRPTNEVAPYRSDPRDASPVWGVERAEIQLREIQALSPARTHLLDDRWAPDLDAAVADIAQDRSPKRRRSRGLALLSVLSRAWDRHYVEHQSASAVHAWYGWSDAAEVIATWLSRVAEATWLPSASGRLRPPVELLLPTEANRIAYGTDRSIFLAEIDEAILRGPAVQALRIRRGPSASSLIAKLRELSAVELTPDVADQARQIYHLLALAIPPEGRTSPVDDMSVAEFRGSFTPSHGRPGLLLAGNQWLGPKDVFAGPPVFGAYRPFVPHSQLLRPLWRLIGIHEPTAADCIAVLRDLAAARLDSRNVGVMLETTRTLASLLNQTTPQLRGQLGHLALWTNQGWVKTRPVYAIEDPKLASEVASQVPVWAHGFTSLAGLEELVKAFNVTVIRREDFVSSSLTARDRIAGDQVRARFASAVQHLRDELARGDPALHDSISISWSALSGADVFVAEDLLLKYTTTEGISLSIDADAHVVRTPLSLIVRSASLMGSAEGAGAAVASLFAGDHQKVAWAWASMWQRAEAGQASAGVVLSHQGGDDDDGSGTARLLMLKGQSAVRRGRSASDASGSRAGGSPDVGPIIVRVLKDMSELQANEGSIVNEGQRRTGIQFPPSGPITRPEPGPATSQGAGVPGHNQGKPVSTSSLPRRPILPPVTEREQLAFDAVQAALALDPPEIADLRARRGVGADAMDDLRQLYEIKMDSGELSNEITLTRNEAMAAQDPDFFLALVSGLEEGDIPLSVRFVFDPLRRLSLRITGDITLSGLREVEALEYLFDRPI
jgi:hypothetical protein